MGKKDKTQQQDVDFDGDYVIKPESKGSKKVDTTSWPLLLRNFESLNVKSSHFTPIPKGFSPLKRPLADYLKYGMINLDKPSNPSSHEVVAWVKKILKVVKSSNLGGKDWSLRYPGSSGYRLPYCVPRKSHQTRQGSTECW